MPPAQLGCVPVPNAHLSSEGRQKQLNAGAGSGSFIMHQQKCYNDTTDKTMQSQFRLKIMSTCIRNYHIQPFSHAPLKVPLL